MRGQCLRIAVAFVMRVPVHFLPLRLEGQHINEWLETVSERYPVTFEWKLKRELDPPPTGPWVACVPASDPEHPEDNHALPMVGRTPQIDAGFFPNAFEDTYGGLVVLPA